MKTFEEWAATTKFTHIENMLEPLAKKLTFNAGSKFPEATVLDVYKTVCSVGMKGPISNAACSSIIATAISQIYECQKEKK